MGPGQIWDFSKLLFCGILDNGTRTDLRVFKIVSLWDFETWDPGIQKNLKFPKLQDMSIQNELILS